jgi:hypothetical protein
LDQRQDNGDNAMTQLAVPHRARGWSVEGFRTFWAKPSLSFLPAIRQLVTDDIVGHWPRPIGDVADPDLYLGVIADILTICPDWTLSVPEDAQSGNLYFIRWIATGTDANGRFEFVGCDRIKLDANGRVLENFVFCDHPFFSRIDARRGRKIFKSIVAAG